MDPIEKAKAKLMFEHPFFGMLATKLEIEENSNIDSFKATANKLIYNSQYLKLLTTSEVTTVLANSAMHQMLYHQERQRDKIEYIWQIASDYAINNLLAQNGFDIPPLANYDSRFEGLYAEEIYKTLLTQLDIKESKQQEQTTKNSEYELFLEELINKYSKLNELPHAIEKFIKPKSKKMLSWKSILYRYINYNAKLDYTLFPSNKKHLYRGVALPSINSNELKIVVAIDTSASISKDKLELFLSELDAIMQSFTHYKILFLQADYKIQNISYITPATKLQSKIVGGGSTDFRAVFEYIKTLREDYRFLIYFSDGDGVFPNKKPYIDTLWILTKENKIPFGKKIVINN